MNGWQTLLYKEVLRFWKVGFQTVAAPVLTESLLVGDLALRAGKDLEWDAAKMAAAGCPQADALVKPAFREGWGLEG